MTEDPIINLEIRFLLARYGQERVLKAIADVGKVTFSELLSALEAYESRDKGSRKRKHKTAAELIAKMSLASDTEPLVEKLGLEFEGGSFLPRLTDVRRFLASCGVETSIKSRREALPAVIKALGTCNLPRLEELAESTDEGKRGDLGLIADHILGQK